MKINIEEAVLNKINDEKISSLYIFIEYIPMR
jgi:hypothetical protein